MTESGDSRAGEGRSQRTAEGSRAVDGDTEHCDGYKNAAAAVVRGVWRKRRGAA